MKDLPEKAKPEKPRSPNPYHNGLQDALHEHYQVTRMAAYHALDDGGYGWLRKLAVRMGACGSIAAVFIEAESGKLHTWIHRCKVRCCPMCASIRSAGLGAEFGGVIRGMKHPSHLVLTLASSDRPLGDERRRILRMFRGLRNTDLWRRCVRGGFYVFEATWKSKSGQWHPHLHVVIDHEYMPHRALRRLWQGLTGDSSILHIHRIANREAAAHEMAKYAGKPQDLDSLPAQQIREWMVAVRGARLVSKFGDCYGKGPVVEEEFDHKPARACRVSIPRLAFDGVHGDATSCAVAGSVAELSPRLAPYVLSKLPALDPEMAAYYVEVRRARRNHEPRPPPPRASLSGEGRLLAELRGKVNGRAYLEAHPELTVPTS